MRFEVVKVEDEPLNKFFGDVYTIKDNVDSKSPVNTFRLLKPTANKVCDWLNELVGEEFFDDKVKKAIKKLWDDDGYEYMVVDDVHIIIELKQTLINSIDILSVLPNADIGSFGIGFRRYIYCIKERK